MAKDVEVRIEAPKFEYFKARIEGTAPYVQNKFSVKARNMIRATQEAGSQSKSKRKREAKNFDECFQNALYKFPGGGYGMPASAFRQAMVSACRLVGFKMTLAKLSVMVQADGYDEEDGTPLVKIVKGDPVYHETYVRNASGVVDLRARPMWREGWQAEVCIGYDADQFSQKDIVNLLSRVGMQVGIGEGRPDSKDSCGLGWGLFKIMGGK